MLKEEVMFEMIRRPSPMRSDIKNDSFSQQELDYFLVGRFST